MYLGHFAANSTVLIEWDTVDLYGSPVSRTSLGTIRIYKDGGTTQRTSTNGITDTNGFDSVTGAQLTAIDLSDNTHVGFYASGSDYSVMVEGATINGVSGITRRIGKFRIGNATVDVSATGAATVADAVWDEVTSGHTTSGTFGEQANRLDEIETAVTSSLPSAIADIDSDLAVVDSNVDSINSTVSSTIPSAIADVAADVDAVLVDTNELQTDWADGGRLDVILDARASQTSVNTIDDFLDTEIAAILADTNELQTDWADGGRLDVILDARASQTSVNTIDDFLDTEIAAILADTNELQTDWADGGRLDLILDARASQTSLDTLDDFVDTEVAAIKAVTDKLDTAVELDGAVYRFTTNALEQAPTGGSAPTAAEIADAVWDEATAGHTTGGTFGEQLKTDVDAILADTNELQTDWADGGRLDVILDARASQTSVNTIDDFLDTEIAAILADTNELQTDWADGGRLDLILDARASQASVNAVDDFVDTEVAAIKAVTDKLDTAVELDGGVYRFTTNALEQAPTGGSAPTAAEIADAVWDESTAGHVTAGTFGEQLKTDVDAILADTNELQADWANGGRLDSILDARASQATVDAIDTIVDSILVDTGTDIPASLTALASAVTTVDTVVDAILVDTDVTIPGLIATVDTVVDAILADTATLPASSALLDACIHGTIDNTTVTPTVTTFAGDAALSSTNNFYNDAVLTFTSGSLKGIARKITDYTGATRAFIFSGTGSESDASFPSAPANGDTFVIVGRIGTCVS